MSELNLTSVFLGCHPIDKKAWAAKAAQEKLSLEDWIQQTLNDACGHEPAFKLVDSCSVCNFIYDVEKRYVDDGFCSDKCRKSRA